eukprot:5295081-Pyramimonas_sp.AAC.1
MSPDVFVTGRSLQYIIRLALNGANCKASDLNRPSSFIMRAALTFAKVISQGIREAFRIQNVHGCTEGSNPRKDETLGVSNIGGLFYLADSVTQIINGIPNTSNVANPVVKQGNLL